MKITDLLTKESIDLNVKASNKKDVIEPSISTPRGRLYNLCRKWH